MRSDDEDEEDEFDEENEEDEDDGMGGTQMNGDAEDDEGGPGEINGVDPSSAAESDEEDGDEDGDGDDDDEEEDGDDDEEEDDDDNDDDEDDEEGSDDDEEDVEMAADGDGDAVSTHSQTSQTPKAKAPTHLPAPPHLVRRSLFTPSFPSTSPPSNFSIEAIVGIPHPTATHSIASTSCSSYLLTGSQDGYVRVYDFWQSLNGGQILTVAQRAAVGHGEGINKGGVGKGWWRNDVDSVVNGNAVKTPEPVYSMACEGDGLWALTGTQSGQINMYSLRHSPGTQLYTLKGHNQVVSCLSLLPNERGLLSGSWDGTVREWDLNTGQTVRKYATHGAQVSSIALRPYTAPDTPTTSQNGETETNGQSISISINPQFFEKKAPEESAESQSDDEPNASAVPQPPPAEAGETKADVEMAETKSQDSYDPLFDEDADGEEVPPSGEVSTIATPTANAIPQAKPALSLALPSSSKQPPSSSSSTPLFTAPPSSAISRQGLASTIPLLSPTRYQAFSNDVLLTSTMDGQVTLMDRRVPSHDGGRGVGRLMASEKAPPWCMSACWSSDGSQVLAGRRNGTVDIWDVRKASTTTPSLLRTLKTPNESGPISCIVPFPDGRHVATASQDNVRLWNTAEYFDPEDMAKRSKSKPPFKIIAGHHGGTISSMLVDPTCRFLITASGNRGWQGESTKVVLIHEIKW